MGRSTRETRCRQERTQCLRYLRGRKREAAEIGFDYILDMCSTNWGYRDPEPFLNESVARDLTIGWLGPSVADDVWHGMTRAASYVEHERTCPHPRGSEEALEIESGLIAITKACWWIQLNKG